MLRSAHTVCRFDMENPLKKALLLLAATSLCLTGCVVGPNYHAPKTSVPGDFNGSITNALTSATTQPTTRQTNVTVDLTHWWVSLQDPELDSLVERAVQSNLDLQIAGARLQEARSLEAAVGGGVVPVLGYSPGIDIAAAAGRGTGSDSTRGRIPNPLHAGSNTFGLKEITHVVGFDAGWELDLFGRFSREVEAAQADTQAYYEARNDVLISLVSEVVRDYVDLRALQLRLEIARENVEIQRQTARLVGVKFRNQLANNLDVALAQRQLSATQSLIAPLQAAVSQAQRRLATLLGLYPEQLKGELEAAAALPATPPQVGPGMPVDLLRRRPDIRRAERQLAAANARIGVATSDLFPRLAITAGAGFQGQGLGRTPVENSLVWSVGPAFYWPFLDFGRLDSVITAQDYRTQQMLYGYKKTVINAVREVDDALANYTAEQDHLAQLAVAVDYGKRAVVLANERFNNGLTPLLDVMDAERQLYGLEDQYAVAEESLLQQFVALYKALGGGWEGFEAPPPPKPPRPAIFAAGARTIGGKATINDDR